MVNLSFNVGYDSIFKCIQTFDLVGRPNQTLSFETVYLNWLCLLWFCTQTPCCLYRLVIDKKKYTFKKITNCRQFDSLLIYLGVLTHTRVPPRTAASFNHPFYVANFRSLRSQITGNIILPYFNNVSTTTRPAASLSESASVLHEANLPYINCNTIQKWKFKAG